MNHDPHELYALLGVAPGASASELKAAYRDLAKVWHPDRFAHDPRLQQKAQEKLKEINDAYERLASGTTTRRPGTPPPRTSSPPRPSATQSAAPPPVDAQPRSSAPGTTTAADHPPRWRGVILLGLAFAAVFVISASFLIFGRGPASAFSPTTPAAPEQTQPHVEPQLQLTDSAAKPTASEPIRNDNKKSEPLKRAVEPKSADAPPVEQAVATAAPVRPLLTVTVTIDPSTGMIARGECPHKSRMTYPSGNEPRQLCTASHQSETSKQAAPSQQQPDMAQPKDSRLKSAVKRIASPKKWF